MSIEKINYELCNGCAKCRNICPVDVIRMDKASKKPVIKYKEDCMLCQLCVVECKQKAIIVTPEKAEMVITSWE
ncbi:MAG: 4Fe-4S dicluster domain-containing protein [Lentisphaerae bacterium]|nr:4Fe-4S dicluster domain-containing protein [Lentisphaerota bacterium]MCP4101351.1 4Fe-4S dicluster domain-containing protein [Lentisphaerota bacterium]